MAAPGAAARRGRAPGAAPRVGGPGAARRAPDALPSDQVLVVFEYADYTLSETQRWDSMGMRGTDSSGFNLFARGGIDQILPDAYADIHSATMVPFAHLLWSSAWAGIAAGAVERARLFVRKAARGGQTPPGAVHFLSLIHI